MYPPRILVASGGTVSYYEPATNTHVTSKDAYDETLAGQPFPLMSNYQVGYAAEVGRIAPSTRPTRSEELLGRTLAVYGNESPGTDGLWVDHALSFIVKLERAKDLNAAFVAEITRLAYNVPIEDRVFSFVPPAGSREVDPEARSSGGASSSGPAPDGFLKPTYLPAGYRQRGSGSGTSGGVTSEYTLSIESDTTGDKLEIRELFRAGGPLPQQVQGEKVAMKQGVGYVSIEGGYTVLIFTRGDITSYLRSSQLGVDELIRIAESMQ
jgi:hypothetical protein